MVCVRGAECKQDLCPALGYSMENTRGTDFSPQVPTPPSERLRFRESRGRCDGAAKPGLSAAQKCCGARFALQNRLDTCAMVSADRRISWLLSGKKSKIQIF
jgi:hypothetical protein